jgi:plasmid stabilization system protein ParE
MKLRFTPAALEELDKVLDDISSHSPQGAGRVQARIKTIIDLLLEHPNAGQRTNLSSMRRIVVTPYPYLIFYEHSADDVVIIGVRHAARDPRSMPDQ